MKRDKGYVITIMWNDNE